jgi:Rieske Fe-S protein
MRCPHQGAELQVFGDRLQCPAHGSEFNDKGVVKTGPADTNLRTFPVSINKDQLLISLK